jgi:hypothetical protein
MGNNNHIDIMDCNTLAEWLEVFGDYDEMEDYDWGKPMGEEIWCTEMRLHDLLRQVAGVMMPNRADELYSYFLHTFDDNGGFLRTRHQYWEQPLKDHKVPNLKKVLVAIQDQPFDPDCGLLFDDRTLLDLELFYIASDEPGCMDHLIDIARQVDYTYTCIVDLMSKTYVLGGKSYQEYADEGILLG